MRMRVVSHSHICGPLLRPFAIWVARSAHNHISNSIWTINARPPADRLTQYQQSPITKAGCGPSAASLFRSWNYFGLYLPAVNPSTSGLRRWRRTLPRPRPQLLSFAEEDETKRVSGEDRTEGKSIDVEDKKPATKSKGEKGPDMVPVEEWGIRPSAAEELQRILGARNVLPLLVDAGVTGTVATIGALLLGRSLFEVTGMVHIDQV